MLEVNRGGLYGQVCLGAVGDDGLVVWHIVGSRFREKVLVPSCLEGPHGPKPYQEVWWLRKSDPGECCLAPCQ